MGIHAGVVSNSWKAIYITVALYKKKNFFTAHGKRSSGSAIVDSKTRLVERNSRGGNQLNLLDDDNSNRFVANKVRIYNF